MQSSVYILYYTYLKYTCLALGKKNAVVKADDEDNVT